MADEKTQDTIPPERTANFFEAYTNNINFELESLDVTIVFGRSRPNKPILQHSAITMSWPEAKLMAHLLQVNLAIYEVISGQKITVPPDLMPTPPAPPSGDDPKAKRLFDAITKVHEDFKKTL